MFGQTIHGRKMPAFGDAIGVQRAHGRSRTRTDPTERCARTRAWIKHADMNGN
jgi:hypothetical protein